MAAYTGIVDQDEVNVEDDQPSCTEQLFEDSNIRYDGVLQDPQDNVNARGEKRMFYVYIEYANILMGTLVYPAIPIIFMWVFVVHTEHDPAYCFDSGLESYYVVLALDSLFILHRLRFFVVAITERNRIFQTKEYSQIGGLWFNKKTSIGFSTGQFMKDFAAGMGVTGPQIDLFSDVVSVLVIVKVTLAFTHGAITDSPTEVAALAVLAVTSAATVIHICPRILAMLFIPQVIRSTNIQGLWMLQCFSVQDIQDTRTDGALRDEERNELTFLRVLPRLFAFADNRFVPLLFPVDTRNLNVQVVKDNLAAQMRRTILKVLFVSIPQAVSQIFFTRILKELGCAHETDTALFVSAGLSIAFGAVNLAVAVRDYMKYKTAAAKMIVNRYLKGGDAVTLSTGEKRRTITADCLSHEDLKVIAEYFLAHPARVGQLNIEKGKLTGYDSSIKIQIPKSVKQDYTYRVRLNFCPGYVTFADAADHQVIIDFAQSFPRLELDPGFKVAFPSELREKLAAMEHVTITKGGF